MATKIAKNPLEALSQQQRDSNTSTSQHPAYSTMNNEEQYSAEELDDAGRALRVQIRNELRRDNAEMENNLLREVDRRMDRVVTNALRSQMDKKRKLASDFTFNRNGNKIRYENHDKTLKILDQAVDAIDTGAFVEAREHIKSGMNLIEQQQKLIRIADREDDGWDVVKHYIEDDLAEGSGDEKNLKKARKDAAADKKKKQEKRASEHRKRNRGRGGYGNNTGQNFFRFGTENRPHSERSQFGQRSKICWSCGREGHIAATCTRGSGQYPSGH